MGCFESKPNEILQATWTFKGEKDTYFIIEGSKGSKIVTDREDAKIFKERVELYLSKLENKEGD